MKVSFRCAEKILYEHPDSVEKLRRLWSEYQDNSVHVQKYVALPGNTEHADPVADVVDCRLRLERKMAGLSRRVLPVLRLEDRLAWGETYREKVALELLRRRYWGGDKKDLTAAEAKVRRWLVNEVIRELDA